MKGSTCLVARGLPGEGEWYGARKNAPSGFEIQGTPSMADASQETEAGPFLENAGLLTAAWVHSTDATTDPLSFAQGRLASQNDVFHTSFFS